MTSHSLTILFMQEGHAYVAGCLERDIFAQGNSLEDAWESFEAVLFATIYLAKSKNRPTSLEHIEPAPQWYHLRARDRDAIIGRMTVYIP